jgi:RNA polymerase sigma factor (sigma-70 family)
MDPRTSIATGWGTTETVPAQTHPGVDADVIAGFRAGKPDDVRAVYRAYSGMVYGVAVRMLGDRGLAEEAAQRAFVNAWRAAASFDESRPLGPWLATIARRAAIDVHRHEQRRTHTALGDVSPADPAVVVLPPSAERTSDVWAVREAIGALPPDERQVVQLQHQHELTHTEIAERLNVPLGTVKSRSHRAHRRLAAALGHLREPIAQSSRTPGLEPSP